MKLPKSLNVFGKKIKIKVGDIGEGYDGLFYPKENLIVISLTASDVDHVLLHEFLHAVLERCSLTQVVSYPSEEVLIDMITKCLLENFDIKPK